MRIPRFFRWLRCAHGAAEPHDSHAAAGEPGRKLRARYHAALASLSPAGRQIFELHCLHDRSIEQIALEVQLPSREVECLLATALATIARALDDPAG